MRKCIIIQHNFPVAIVKKTGSVSDRYLHWRVNTGPGCILLGVDGSILNSSFH